MERERDELTPDEYELDRQAWNLPRPVKKPQPKQSLFSVPFGREDKAETEIEAA